MKRYKVSDSYIIVSKLDNMITIIDDNGFTESHIYNGSIAEFMFDTFYSYEVASIQP